ncbi:MAG: methyltransferase domain-containing protein [Candidatus Marinimicrobia bacterium]|nr:methyltransferase domain-containing protein [Candidatus Neomarinimicrobiota bacterium]
MKRSSARGNIKIMIGASGVRQAGWAESEQRFLDLLKPEMWKRYFKPGSIDAILAEHVWEHLSLDDGRDAANCCLKFLKPGGYLRVAVPDGLNPIPEYIEQVRPGGIGAGAQDHKILYTYATFQRLFELAGFKVVLYEYFDEEGIFHYHEWDPDDGLIKRSKRFDQRNTGGEIAYNSIILDAVKPDSVE